MKIFYYENLEPYDTGGTHRITLPDHFFHLYLQWWKNSLVTWSVYRVVSARYDFRGMLIDKTNTTLIYILFVILLFSDCQQSLMNTN